MKLLPKLFGGIAFAVAATLSVPHVAFADSPVTGGGTHVEYDNATIHTIGSP